MDDLGIAASPRTLARVAGLLYLIQIAVGVFDEAFVKGRIVVAGDAAATAANLHAMEWLWRLGIAGEMVMGLVGLPLLMILYVLLKPVGRLLALLMAGFALLASAVEASHSLYLLQALFPLGDAAYLKAFTPEQLGVMARLALRSQAVGFGIALLMFGPYFLAAGRLIFRSTFFPKTIGVLYQIAGLAYLALGFGLILTPDFAGRLFQIIVLPAFVGEVSFSLYLLIKGVDVEKWRAVAAGSVARSA
jgi:hypothetical protein